MLGLGLLLAATAGLVCCGSREQRGTTAAKPARTQVREITPEELGGWLAKGRNVTLIDVREDNEWQAGHAATALHIPRWTLAGRIETVVPDRNALVVLYCKGGVRSAACAATMERMGYRNVFSLAGGFERYRAAGLPA